MIEQRTEHRVSVRGFLFDVLKDVAKTLAVGVLGWIGVVVANQVPAARAFLEQRYQLPLSQLLLFLVATAIAGACVARIAQRDRIKRLTELTRRDDLTGLFNLRALKQMLGPAIKAGAEAGQPLSVIFIDIDGFKDLNSRVGFQAANYVLEQFAAVLTFNPKKSDLFFRYGGDEFLILAPGTPLSGGLVYAEILRKAVESHSFKVRGGSDENLTLSAGVAELSGNASPEEFLKRAEVAFFRAKRRRNAVEEFRSDV